LPLLDCQGSFQLTFAIGDSLHIVHALTSERNSARGRNTVIAEVFIF